MSYTNQECEKGSSRRRRVSGRRGATWDPCPCTSPWPCLLLGILALALLLGLALLALTLFFALLLLLALHALTALLVLRVRVLDAGLVGPHALFAGFESEAVGLRGALLFAVRLLAALLAALRVRVLDARAVGEHALAG